MGKQAIHKHTHTHKQTNKQITSNHMSTHANRPQTFFSVIALRRRYAHQTLPSLDIQNDMARHRETDANENHNADKPVDGS